MSVRYIAKQEPGNDWGVFDTVQNIFKCAGLDEGEAQDTANQWNASREKETKNFIENA